MHMLITNYIFQIAHDRLGRTTRRAQLEQAALPMAPRTDEAVNHANACTYIHYTTALQMPTTIWSAKTESASDPL